MTSTARSSATRGVIAMGEQTTFSHHRSGWGPALDALRAEHDDRGVAFYGFLDGIFNPGLNPRYAQMVPIGHPWTGFFHNPPTMPPWFPDEPRLTKLLKRDDVLRSMENCVGLFTLSEHLAEFLRGELKLPTSALIFPTEIPDHIFSFEAFLANPRKRVVSVGWWLRRAMSIFYLPLDAQTPYRKARLNFGGPLDDTSRGLARLEFVHDWRHRKLDDRFKSNTEELPYLPHREFDRLLAENIVYLDLYDSSANNAVVECIARATPLLVNKIAPVVEYLGADYPLYFETLEEAAAKALDFDMVRRAHEHLLTCPARARLSQQAFLDDFRSSEVYGHLRAATSIATQSS
jgi:hypothetical protein